jgi:hypothetical protein
MASYIELRDRLVADLVRASKGYFAVGVKEFLNPHSREPQSAAGNLAIALEFMLKAYLATRSPLLIYREVSDDIRIPLICHADFPSERFWIRAENELRSPQAKLIGLKECLTTAFLLLPQMRIALDTHGEYVCKIRNASVHGVIHRMSGYDIDRTAYATIRAAQILNEMEPFLKRTLYVTKQSQDFTAAFDSNRVEYVRTQIEAARVKLKSLTSQAPAIEVDDWDLFVISCPVCQSDCLLTGETSDGVDVEPEGDAHVYLEFGASSLSCKHCGLTLRDREELRLADVDRLYNRSSELDRWFGDDPYPDPDDFPG